MKSKVSKALVDQVERINDSTRGQYVDVIVQMESDRRLMRGLSKAASRALGRRRMSLTPRDILPGAYDKSLTRAEQGATASTRSLLGKSRAAAETITLAKIQKRGLESVAPMLESNIIRTAIGRKSESAKKSDAAKSGPVQFWTSQSMYLRLTKEELRDLPGEARRGTGAGRGERRYGRASAGGD